MNYTSKTHNVHSFVPHLNVTAFRSFYVYPKGYVLGIENDTSAVMSKSDTYMYVAHIDIHIGHVHEYTKSVVH